MAVFLPRRSSGGGSGRGAGTRRTVRIQGDDRAGVRRRTPVSATPAAGRAHAPRRARLPRHGGRRDARHERCVGQQPVAPRAGGVRVAAAGRRTGAGATTELAVPRPRPSTGSRKSVQNGDIDELVTLLTGDAWLTMPPTSARLPGARRDRRLPSGRGGAPRRADAAAADPGQHAAGVCVLRVGARHRWRTRVRAVRPDVAGGQISAITWFAGPLPWRSSGCRLCCASGAD